jgi:hypothetical protein
MAQLYSYVSDRCDDEQVAQYDEVLCQLAELVEVRGAGPCRQASGAAGPGAGQRWWSSSPMTISKWPAAARILQCAERRRPDRHRLANQSEEHRVAIAGRTSVPERVGEAIVEHGEKSPSVVRLVRNSNAEFGAGDAGARSPSAPRRTMPKSPRTCAGVRRSRLEVACRRQDRCGRARQGTARTMSRRSTRALDPVTVGKVNAVVYNRMRNRAGFLEPGVEGRL